MLAVHLFPLEKRRLVLTEAGTVFRHHASLGLQELEQAAAVLRPGASGGTIRVDILPTAATRLIPRVAPRFHAAQSGALLKIETGPHAYLLGLLRERRIDLMIGSMLAPDEMAGLTFDHLSEEDIVLVLRAGHPMAVQPMPVLLQLVPLILPPEGALIRRAVDDYLASLGLSGLRPAVEAVALAIGRGISGPVGRSLVHLARGGGRGTGPQRSGRGANRRALLVRSRRNYSNAVDTAPFRDRATNQPLPRKRRGLSVARHS